MKRGQRAVHLQQHYPNPRNVNRYEKCGAAFIQPCANCGRSPAGMMFTMNRVVKHGIPLVLEVAEINETQVPLCADCCKLFSRDYGYRIVGYLVTIGGLLGGVALVATTGLEGLWLWPISILVGLFMIIKGRSRLAALERRVGF